jgi:hypothetical protein
MYSMDDDVRDFLLALAPPHEPTPRLQAEASRWADSGDLNEAWIASIRLQARQLLERERGAVYFQLQSAYVGDPHFAPRWEDMLDHGGLKWRDDTLNEATLKMARLLMTRLQYVHPSADPYRFRIVKITTEVVAEDVR